MLKLVTVNEQMNAIEARIEAYKNLNNQIKELEAMKEKMKKELIADYFGLNEEYRNKNDRVLATYKEHERNDFNTKKFKEDHNDIYNMYCVTNRVKTFLVK